MVVQSKVGDNVVRGNISLVHSIKMFWTLEELMKCCFLTVPFYSHRPLSLTLPCACKQLSNRSYILSSSQNKWRVLTRTFSLNL